MKRLLAVMAVALLAALALALQGGAPSAAYLDDVVLVLRTGPTPRPGAGPDLHVDAGTGRHPISPDIYGMNFADEALAQELRLPVRRWGGNSTTRYNWQIDVHNTASDWYFENIPDDNDHPELLPDGSTVDRFVEQDRRTGTGTLLTMPLIGWTPNRRLADHPFDCGFKVSIYGPQESTDPWDPDCGNGVAAGGGDITGNDPADTSVAVGPEFVQAWIGHLTNKYGPAVAGGVRFYALDNEPMLWPFTHRDVHPELTGYDEMLERTLAYASAIKAADPTALTLGPVTWGWCAWFYSALDGCAPGGDYDSHGGLEFTPWYLAQLRAYEQQGGQRLLDYLDLHVYPQGDGIFDPDPGSPATQAFRLRSTRALWDPTYVDETWIARPIALIPLMHSWVDQHYPGTRLSLSEYNWGALGHLNGALAQADLLGIFGRERLDLAALWDPPGAADPGAFAFRIFRNYDGAGSHFGETSVHAASADQDRLAIYAAQRAADGALTLVVINKTGQALVSPVALSGFDPGTRAWVYRYSGEQPAAIVRQADQVIAGTGFTATWPAQSISLLVLPPAGQPAYRLYLPLILRLR